MIEKHNLCKGIFDVTYGVVSNTVEYKDTKLVENIKTVANIMSSERMDLRILARNTKRTSTGIARAFIKVLYGITPK